MPGLAIVPRLIDTLTLVSGQARTLDLPRDFAYAGLTLELSMTVDIAAGGGANGTLSDDNPYTFLRKIELEGTGGAGSVTFKNFRGVDARRVSHLLTGKEPYSVAVTSAGVGTTTVRAIVPIDCALPGQNVSPEDAVRTIIDPSEFGALRLRVTAGDSTDFSNGGSRVITLSALSLDVIALQAVNVPIGAAAKSRPARYVEVMHLIDETSALQVEHRPRQPLPTGSVYRYIMLRTTDETVNNRQPVDDTLASSKVFLSQTQVLRLTTLRQLIALQRSAFPIVDAVNPAGLNALSSALNPAIGYYVYDFLRTGRLQGLIDTSRFPTKGIVLDLINEIATASTREVSYTLGTIERPRR